MGRDQKQQRTAWRAAVLKRDDERCVICKAPGTASAPLDVHHIIERKAWPDGGYILDNGASLCSKHHLEAEHTTLSVEAIRKAAGILTVVLPPGWNVACRYDKWGNRFEEEERRIAGPLAHDDGCQRALAVAGVVLTDEGIAIRV